MQAFNPSAAAPGSAKRLWAGRILTALAVLFLLFDSSIKIAREQHAVAGSVQLGYPDSLVRPIGIVLLVCLALYALPRTAVLGAILLTGYLGGAVATQVRVGAPLFGYVLSPVYVALFIWGGLYLRDDRLRALIPMRSARTH